MPTIPEILATAVQHHQGGRLQAAERIYRQILEVEPNQPDAIHLLGAIAHQTGRLDEAAACFRHVLLLKPDFAAAHKDLGNTLKKQGKLDEAAACYRHALELKPDFAEAHNNLGNTMKIQGKLDEAVACYRRTLELKPDSAAAHGNLGVALKEQGKLEEAAACQRRALELKPDYAEARYNLGNVLREQGKLDQAVACFRRSLELKPDFAEAHLNLGNALKEQGKLDEAVACCRRAVELKPDYAEAHSNLGAALTEQGKPDEAVACCRRALELRPDVAAAHGNLGNALKAQGRPEEAIASYRRALELKPDFAEVHGNIGNALRDQGKVDEALAAYRRALELNPDFAEAHGNLGSALEEMGDLQGAEDSFRAALRHDPRSAFAHYKLAELLRGKLAEQDLAAQRRLLEQDPASSEQRIDKSTTVARLPFAPRKNANFAERKATVAGLPIQRDLTDAQRLLLHFGLAQVLDARGEYAEAAKHLERGNALQLSERRKCGQQYDPKECELLVTRTIAVCEPDFFERVSGFGLESELPVFIVGLPRSGTTLIEQILAGHGQVFAAGEIKLAHETMAALAGQDADFIEGLRRLDRPTARRLASRHLQGLRRLNPAALRVVHKSPENYLFLGLLAGLFPRAKFIHCRRDLRDTAVSCWITPFQEVPWANDQEHIASRFHEYRRIMEHWRKALPVPLLEVNYEETVADPEGVARRLVAWCGLAWEPKCLEFQRAKRPVRTASAVQVRQPVFSTSVGRWKHYEQALASLLARLEEV